MRILIGSCTQHDVAGFEKTPAYTTMLKGCGQSSQKQYEFYESTTVNAVIKTKNKENIGKHYNKVIQLGISENYDCIVLMHDDVSMEDAFLDQKLERAFTSYDIVGLAGARHVEIKSPALWHLMSERKFHTGCVAHPYEDVGMVTHRHHGGVIMTVFGPTPRRCLVLDGVFLAIKVSSLTDEVRFDENIPSIAHHYDLDFCLTANKNKLKLTSWPIWAVHQSPGLDTPSEQFDVSEKYFIDKWKTN
jgi:GT2 family glycosyltransferase